MRRAASSDHRSLPVLGPTTFSISLMSQLLRPVPLPCDMVRRLPTLPNVQNPPDFICQCPRFDLPKIYRSGLSGTGLDLPGFQRALLLCFSRSVDAVSTPMACWVVAPCHTFGQSRSFRPQLCSPFCLHPLFFAAYTFARTATASQHACSVY